MRKFFILVAATLFMPFSLFAAMNSSNYQIYNDSFSSGGGENGSSTNYKLRDTVGQGVYGNASSTNYDIKGGFRENRYFSGQETISLSISASSMELGDLATDLTRSGTHRITVDSNSDFGIAVVYSGRTLTCDDCGGINEVTAIGGSGAASSAGVSQFGLNAIFESSGGTPSAESTPPYDMAGTYAFRSGDTIISAPGDIYSTIFKINYIANISGEEDSGEYSTSVIYTAIGNF